MQKIISLFFKVFRRLYGFIRKFIHVLYTNILCYCNNVTFSKITSNGIPYVSIARSGTCTIGTDFKMNNGLLGNPIGRPQKCVLFVGENAAIIIGNHVGISATAIVAHERITIGDYVKIGGGVCIYDTDFHSLNPAERTASNTDKKNKKTAAVLIENHVFIGAHSTILKGVTVGENAIIGACSLVSKSIPANEIWAGNPARFIKKITNV